MSGRSEVNVECDNSFGEGKTLNQALFLSGKPAEFTGRKDGKFGRGWSGVELASRVTLLEASPH